MGTTSEFALPYPEGSGLVIQGDDAIQALAEAVEAKIRWDDGILQIEPADSASTANGDPVVFPGTQSLTAGFTAGSGYVTYSGPLRLFHVYAEVAITTAGTNLAHVSSTLILRYNGVTDIAGSYDDLVSQTSGPVGTIQTRTVVHKISVPAALSPGDSLAVHAFSTPSSGAIGNTSMRIYPIGPA